VQPLNRSPGDSRAPTTRRPLSFPAILRVTKVRGLRPFQVCGLSPICIAIAVGLFPLCKPAVAAATSAGVNASQKPYRQFVEEAAKRFGIPDRWVRAVMAVESGGNSAAVSPKGAMGLMQIMPETWAALRARYSLGADPFDPHDNILAGAAYLRELFDRFGQSGFLAAYNAGPARVQGYLAGLNALPGETIRYVAKLDEALSEPLTADVRIASPRAPDWPKSGLFAASRPSSDAHSSNASAAVATTNTFALVPQSTGLFVAVEATSR
jgi:hypothetical protein